MFVIASLIVVIAGKVFAKPAAGPPAISPCQRFAEKRRAGRSQMIDVLDYKDQRHLGAHFRVFKTCPVLSKTHSLKEPDQPRSAVHKIELRAPLTTGLVRSRREGRGNRRVAMVLMDHQARAEGKRSGWETLKVGQAARFGKGRKGGYVFTPVDPYGPHNFAFSRGVEQGRTFIERVAQLFAFVIGMAVRLAHLLDVDLITKFINGAELGSSLGH